MEHLVRELMIKMEFQNCQMKVLTKRISAVDTEKCPKQSLTRTSSNGYNSIYRNNSLSTPKKSPCNQYVVKIVCKTYLIMIFYTYKFENLSI